MSPGKGCLKTKLATGILVLSSALLVNGVIFGLAPWLKSGRPQSRLDPPIRMAVMVPQNQPEEKPAQEPKPPGPPPPKVVKKLTLKAHHTSPPQPQMRIEAPCLDMSLEMANCPALPVPPPPPSAPKPSRGKLDHGPMVVGRIPPPYPYLARRRGVEGWVKVRFLVNPKGQVEKLSLLAAKPEGFFEEAVLRTVPRWRFQPAQRGGRAEEAWIETTIKFELE